MENGYLIAAYAVVWIGIAAYVAWMGAQVGALRRDVTALQETLEEAQSD